MRVLVVSYAYAPALYPRAFRWTAVAEHWAGRGHQVDVVAHGVHGAPARETRGGVRVHRVGGDLAERVRRGLGGGPPAAPPLSSSAAASANGNGAGGGVRAAARWVHDHTWKQLYWPDFACLWYRPAVRAAQALLAEGRYDALVSVSHPFTGHLVGERLKRAHPALPWLVDVGDPFAFIEGTPTNNARLYGGLNHRAERRVLRGADAVAVTTAGTLARYAEAFPESAAKVAVVPPLLSPPEREAAGAPFFPPSPGAMRLVYVGTLHPRLRTPERLLALFRALLDGPLGARLELHFVGPLNGCEAAFAPYAELMGRRVFCHGTVPRQAAFRAMDEAHALVNLGNGSGYQLPSKVVEYAATGRPVLNLAGAADDASAAFFGTYPAALQLPPGAGAETVRRVAEFLERAAPADAESVERCLLPYRVDAVAAGYERLLAGADARAGGEPRR